MKQLVFILFILIFISPSSFAAKKKRHQTAAQTFTLLSCEKLQTSCLQTSDNTESCTATAKGKTLEENGYDSDNADCIKMRIWKKLCSQKIPTDGLKVSCH